MTKFWPVVTTVLVVGVVALLLTGSQNSAIHFSDLETECRYNDNVEEIEKHHISLQDDRLVFEGVYPVQHTNSRTGFDYSQSGGEITLDVTSEDLEASDNFIGTCLGTVVYDAQTRQLDEGRYTVTLRHDGDLVDQRVIVVR